MPMPRFADIDDQIWVLHACGPSTTAVLSLGGLEGRMDFAQSWRPVESPPFRWFGPALERARDIDMSEDQVVVAREHFNSELRGNLELGSTLP